CAKDSDVARASALLFGRKSTPASPEVRHKMRRGQARASAAQSNVAKAQLSSSGCAIIKESDMYDAGEAWKRNVRSDAKKHNVVPKTRALVRADSTAVETTQRLVYSSISVKTKPRM